MIYGVITVILINGLTSPCAWGRKLGMWHERILIWDSSFLGRMSGTLDPTDNFKKISKQYNPEFYKQLTKTNCPVTFLRGNNRDKVSIITIRTAIRGGLETGPRGIEALRLKVKSSPTPRNASDTRLTMKYPTINSCRTDHSFLYTLSDLIPVFKVQSSLSSTI
jgi:hypothetical protein